MTSEQFYAPFNLELLSKSYIRELDTLVELLGESNAPSLLELQNLSQAIHRLQFKIQCAIRLQAHSFRNEYQR